MIIKYQMTFEDIMALQRDLIKSADYHKRRKKLVTILLFIFVICMTTALVAEVLPSSLYNESPMLYSIGAIGVGVLFALMLVPIIKKVYIPLTLWQYKQILKKSKNRKWPKKIVLRINEEGVQQKSEQNGVKGDFRITWQAIHKVTEDKQRLFLYFEEADAIILPLKNSVLHRDEQIEIRTQLKQYLPHLF